MWLRWYLTRVGWQWMSDKHAHFICSLSIGGWQQSKKSLAFEDYGHITYHLHGYHGARLWLHCSTSNYSLDTPSSHKYLWCSRLVGSNSWAESCWKGNKISSQHCLTNSMNVSISTSRSAWREQMKIHHLVLIQRIRIWDAHCRKILSVHLKRQKPLWPLNYQAWTLNLVSKAKTRFLEIEEGPITLAYSRSLNAKREWEPLAVLRSTKGWAWRHFCPSGTHPAWLDQSHDTFTVQTPFIHGPCVAVTMPWFWRAIELIRRFGVPGRTLFVEKLIWLGEAEFNRAAFTSAGLAWGLLDRYTAAKPATWGTAILVPLAQV